uniref:Conserved membrane protein, GtcA family n=1 Tax=Loigolactobacillus rennini TaxID=238013 RepID=A0A1K2I9M9_9LACO|nr:Conserved membrane protein, GtcA family [Loigolactobacillus rennini]
MLKTVWQQLIQFGLVGGLNTLLTYLLYLVLWRGVGATAAMGIGYAVTSLLGLILNRSWVFKSQQCWQKAAWRYYATYLTSFFLSMGLVHLWTQTWGLSETSAPLFSLVLTVPFNFILSKFWVFRQSGVKL